MRTGNSAQQQQERDDVLRSENPVRENLYKISFRFEYRRAKGDTRSHSAQVGTFDSDPMKIHEISSFKCGNRAILPTRRRLGAFPIPVEQYEVGIPMNE